MMKNRTLYALSYLYLYIPILLFLVFWIKPIISVPVILISIYSLVLCIKNIDDEDYLDIRGYKKKILIIIGVIFIWVLLSGIGGFVWQNRNDHMFRNAIFFDLFSYDWPPTHIDESSIVYLCYYIGYWLPSALISKVLGYVSIGYCVQFLWGFLGVILAFLLVSKWLKTINYFTIILLIFFSGLDVLITIKSAFVVNDIRYITNTLSQFEHIELQLYLFNSSSNTTLLFWLYNQAIPFWVGFMLIILQQKNNKILFFTYSLLILFAPFPTLALIPAIIFFLIMNNGKCLKTMQTIISFIRNSISVENIAGLSLIIIISIYYASNISANKFTFLSFSLKNVLKFSIYLVIEYGIYILFVYKRLRKDYFFFILFITMIGCSFVLMGNNYDFAWRTCIPCAFYLMLIVMKEFIEMSQNTWKFKMLILVLFVGSLTPMMEIFRTITQTLKHEESYLSDNLKSTFDDNAAYGNFIGSNNSFFYKYVMRKPKSISRLEN